MGVSQEREKSWGWGLELNATPLFFAQPRMHFIFKPSFISSPNSLGAKTVLFTCLKEALSAPQDSGYQSYFPALFPRVSSSHRPGTPMLAGDETLSSHWINHPKCGELICLTLKCIQ